MEIFNGVIEIRLPILTMLFFTHGCWSQDLVGPEPDVAVLRGTIKTLTCSRVEGGQSGVIAWFEDVPGETPNTLFFGSSKGSTDSKYDNFDIDTDNVDRFDLVISDIAVDDEGTYYCRHVDTKESKYSSLTVEVQSSSLEMSADVRDSTTVTVIEGKPLESEIVCTAVGARPLVAIKWYHQTNGGSETEITTGVSQTNTTNANDADIFDVVSTLQYAASKEYNGGSITCVTTGQYVQPDISREYTTMLNVKYVPVVNVQYGDNEVRCSSDGNPEVEVPNGYLITVNDADQYPPTMCGEDGTCTLDLEVMYNTDVRCNATNSVGTGTSIIVARPDETTGGPTVGAIVGGVVGTLLAIAIVIIIVLVYFLVRKGDSKADSMKQDPSPAPKGRESNAPPQTYLELDPQTRLYESTYQQPLSKDSKAPQTYMGLDPRTRENKSPYQEPLDKDSQLQQHGVHPGSQSQPYDEIKNAKAQEQVYQEIDDNTNKQQSTEYVNVRPTN